MRSSVLNHLTCALCDGKVDPRAVVMTCTRCHQIYPRVGRIPVILPRPYDHVDLWRRQVAFVRAQGRATLARLEMEAACDTYLADTRTRLRALAEGVRYQARELVELLGPALGGELPSSEQLNLPRGADNPVQYLHYLYRDWGWESSDHLENQRSFDAVRSVMSGALHGRTLVVGAGGCRLAYDLHRASGSTETVVVDVDPFLFVIAEAIVRGATVDLTESTANINEVSSAARTYSLSAPAGPIDDASFHFFFANGITPPFSDGTFDTVVTPWFIDQIPPDLPQFLGTIARLLRPRGRWLNHGPLIYPSEAPLGRRFSREELFELAGRAGFRIVKWISESRPYLVSPLNGRGKVEWVLTFEAELVAK